MAEYILEAGGTMAFTFHVLFMLFNLFIIYQFYFNDKFFNELGFSNEAAGCLELLTQAFITCCMDTSIQMELST